MTERLLVTKNYHNGCGTASDLDKMMNVMMEEAIPLPPKASRLVAWGDHTHTSSSNDKGTGLLHI
jgi:hypothetical protein